jgi:hypothetical protein
MICLNLNFVNTRKLNMPGEQKPLMFFAAMYPLYAFVRRKGHCGFYRTRLQETLVRGNRYFPIQNLLKI